MAATCLPAWPFVLFGIIEPLLLIWATIFALNDPKDYYVRQHHDAKHQQIPLTPQAEIFVHQTANIFVLLAGIAVVCCWTLHPDVAKKYLFVIAVADLGHIWAVYKALGNEYFWRIGEWNELVWGAVGVSIFLNINRWATLLGIFGPVQATTGAGKKKA